MQFDLEKSRDEYSHLYNSAPVGYLSIDPDGKILKANLTLANMLQVEPATLNNQPLAKFVIDEDMDRLHIFLRNLLKTNNFPSLEIRFRRKGGPFFWGELKGASQKESGQQDQIYQVAIIDVTDRKMAESQLRQKYKMEAIGVMAGGIAHNFNNNMAIMLGNIEICRTKLPAGTDLFSYLDNAKTAILRSRDLVLKILSFCQKGTYVKAPVQLSTVIEETLKLVSATIPSTVTLELSISSNSKEIMILADSSQLEEVLINLVNNAVHAMDEKGALQILLDSVRLKKTDFPAYSGGQPGQFLKLSVQDTGSGMKAEILDKIFDPFFTTKAPHEGTGMGLSTVQGIIDQHGGFINVQSSPGQGSIFDLFFPVVDTPLWSELPLSIQDLPRGHERILFVDDEEMLVNIGENMLSEVGFQVTALSSSTKAFDLFQSDPHRYDLVITDQTMPGLSGKELVSLLLKIRPDLPIILCTGFSHKISNQEARELGVKAFCMKPLEMSQLIKTVREVLDAKQGSTP